MPRDILFDYVKIGSSIMIDENDWKRIVSYLHKTGLYVSEESRPTKRVLDGAKAPRKSKRSAGSPRK